MSDLDDTLDSIDSYSGDETIGVEFKQARSPKEFADKASELLSNAMDLLNAKIRSEMAEASDIKTAVDIGKMFKVGIPSVDEIAARAMREVEQYSVEVEESDHMRFAE